MKEGILPTSEAITWEANRVERERKKDELAIQLRQKLILQEILKDPAKAEIFLGPDHATKRT